jgi:hypothetical protein
MLSHHHLSEIDADQEAIADLTRQVKGQRGPVAQIVRSRRDQLVVEVQAERKFKKSLAEARKGLVTIIEMASVSTEPELLLSFDDEQILDLILRGGLGLAIDDFIESSDKIRAAVEKSFEALGLEYDPQMLPQLDLIQAQAASAVFEDVIIPDFKRATRDALLAISTEVPTSIVKSDLNIRLEQSEGRQLTEVKTKISQFGRTVTAKMADELGLTNYLYTGPRDGLTRRFCKPLINKVVDDKQMRKLNNNQGLAVKTSCGGYNCRHSWSPVTESFIEAAELTLATGSDINAANSGAKRR